MSGRSSRRSPAPTSAEVAALLAARREGDRMASERLREKLSARLGRLTREMRWQYGGGELAAASEAVRGLYRELVEKHEVPQEDRTRFLGIAAGSVRRLLVEAAFRRSEGGNPRAFDEAVALDRAIDRLARLDPQLGRLVELRCFVGLPLEEAAEAVGISSDLARRDWCRARSLLPFAVGGGSA